MQKVAKRFKIKKIRMTAFHPQSNGSLERSHHALKEFLKQYVENDKNWDEWVDSATLNYNTCVQESTKHTPYEVVFGRLARLPSGEKLRLEDQLPTYKNYIVDLVTKLNEISKLTHENLVKSKEKSKIYYDKTVNEKEFKVGSYVYLLKGAKPRKFGNHFTGPHKVLEVLSKNNIRIQFDKKDKTVHANRLRHSHITSPHNQKSALYDSDSNSDN